MTKGLFLLSGCLIKSLETSYFAYCPHTFVFLYDEGRAMVRFLAVVFSVFTLFSVSGCTSAAIAVVDEKISQMTEMDCTSVNMVFGDPYCKEKREEIKQEPVYCYKTLGGIDCYATKNPYNTEASERVRTVSALGSEGAKVEYLGKEPDTKKSIFAWPFMEAKTDTAELD
ncbi:MAG: hypothetical protein ACJAYR_000077 [Sneathiella sp.]|jgi:hypothetical protein